MRLLLVFTVDLNVVLFSMFFCIVLLNVLNLVMPLMSDNSSSPADSSTKKLRKYRRDAIWEKFSDGEDADGIKSAKCRECKTVSFFLHMKCFG